MTRARQRRTQICCGFGEIAEVDVDREVALARPVEDVHDLVVLEGLWKHPDETHQRRLFVLASDNITSGERSLHIGAADGAPGFDELALDIGSTFGAADGVAVLEEMNDYNGDWDTLYPFSAVSLVVAC